MLLFFWLKTTTELQNYSTAQQSALQTRFDTYSSLFPEFQDFTISNLTTNQTVELRKDGIEAIPGPEELHRSQIQISDEQSLNAGWYDNLSYFYISQDYTLSDTRYRIITLFNAVKLTDIMLQNVIREDAFTVVWLPDSTTIGRNIPEHLAPHSNPATSYNSQFVNDYRTW